jgi:hypothetical protein
VASISLLQGSLIRFKRVEHVPNSGELETICDMLHAVRLALEAHLAHNDSWRALKTAELGSIVAKHLGSDAEEDSRRLHRKLLRTSATYRAYTRLTEIIRILSEASSEFPGSHAGAAKPRVKVKAVSRVLSHEMPPAASKVRVA